MLNSDIHYASTQVNLRRIVALRGVSISLQAMLMAIAYLAMDIAIPMLPAGLVLMALLVWNLFSWWRSHQARPISHREFFFQLVVDVMAFSAVLYFTGGASNPFAWFYLLPLMIAATVLPAGYVWSMAGMTIACYSLLMFFYVPLHPHGAMQGNEGFAQHIFGMWFGFVMSAVLVSYFVSNMARNLRHRDRILAEAREQALRDERIVALGTLAAGAAHELGTPLGSIALVADDLIQDLEDESGFDKARWHISQLKIIREQVKRCKEALSVLSAAAGKQRADEGGAVRVERYLRELIRQWQLERPGVVLSYCLEGEHPAPSILSDRALTQALTNIFNNAADASPDNVELRACWDSQRLRIVFLDRGPGITEEALLRAGKTLFSSKDQGLGVGLFLAHAVIERLGGHVVHQQRAQGGTCTRIELPLLSVSHE